MSRVHLEGREHIYEEIKKCEDEIKRLQSLEVNCPLEREINQLKVEIERRHIYMHENHLEWKALRHILAQYGEHPPDSLKELEEYADKVEYRPECFSHEELDVLIGIPTLEGRQQALYEKIQRESHLNGDTQ